MTIAGRVFKVGDHVNTDLVIAGRYCHLPTADDMARHLFEDLDATFVARFVPGSVLVAGVNFGCGSSREEAATALKAAGVAAVVAAGFARIFFRNCVNIGLPIFECPAAALAVAEGGTLTIDDGAGVVRDDDTGVTWRAAAFPPFMRALVDRGGLMADARARLEASISEGKD